MLAASRARHGPPACRAGSRVYERGLEARLVEGMGATVDAVHDGLRVEKLETDRALVGQRDRRADEDSGNR